MSPETEPGSGQEKTRDWRGTIARMAARMSADDYPPGDLAELRRLDPRCPDGRAFWTFVVRSTPDALDDPPLQFALAVALRGMAIACPFHRSPEGQRRPLGLALAEANVSQQRLLRLLRGGPEALDRWLRDLARLVRSKGPDAAFDWTDAFWLLRLLPDSDRGRQHRRTIARDYYARILSKEKETVA